MINIHNLDEISVTDQIKPYLGIVLDDDDTPFGGRRRAEVFDQLDAQMSDGWGEGFFDSFIMTAPDGAAFYVR